MSPPVRELTTVLADKYTQILLLQMYVYPRIVINTGKNFFVDTKEGRSDHSGHSKNLPWVGGKTRELDKIRIYFY